MVSRKSLPVICILYFGLGRLRFESTKYAFPFEWTVEGEWRESVCGLLLLSIVAFVRTLSSWRHCDTHTKTKTLRTQILMSLLHFTIRAQGGKRMPKSEAKQKERAGGSCSSFAVLRGSHRDTKDCANYVIHFSSVDVALCFLSKFGAQK